MTTTQESSNADLEVTNRLNRIMYRLTGLLGLTTGIGVIAWGVWSILSVVGTFFYEESGVSVDEILINNGLNNGLLLSSIVIALGVIILELKKLQHLMRPDTHPSSGDPAN